MPLWIPQAGEDNVNRHFMEVSIEKAVAAGLKFRPLSETVRDTLTWAQANPDQSTNPNWGLPREREQELLEAWFATQA